MLSLSRRIGESVFIETPHGEIIRVVVSSAVRRQVKLAFDADKSIKINRSEIYLKIKQGVPRTPRTEKVE